MPQTYKFDMASKRISTDSTASAPGAVYSELLTDTLYAVIGTSITAMHAGALALGTWRSRLIKAQSGVPTGFAWIRLNGDLGAGAVVRLFADGALAYTTPTIASGEPLRLPARQARAWEVELSGLARVTSLVLADNTEALL